MSMLNDLTGMDEQAGVEITRPVDSNLFKIVGERAANSDAEFAGFLDTLNPGGPAPASKAEDAVQITKAFLGLLGVGWPPGEKRTLGHLQRALQILASGVELLEPDHSSDAVLARTLAHGLFALADSEFSYLPRVLRPIRGQAL